MAKLYIVEFDRAGKAAMEAVPSALSVPPMAAHFVEFEPGDPSKASVEFDNGTELVLLSSTVPVFIAFGVDPVAVKDLFPLLDGHDLFSVPKARGFRVAVIGMWGDE